MKELGNSEMSSDSDKIADPIEIYFSDAVRFFKAVTNPGACPMCSSVSWQIPVAAKGKPVSLIVSGMHLDGKPQLELKAACNVCGFYRSHSATIIARWLKENPENGDPAGE